MERSVIVSALRTPIGRFMGGLSTLPAPRLAAGLIKETIARTKLDTETVDEVILGNVLQAGVGQAPARQAMIFGGVAPSVAAVTINKVCGSGLKSVMLAAQAIKAGDADIVIAGGMESMSLSPYLLPDARAGQRLGHGRLIDAMINDGLWDCYNDFHMGNTGELVAKKYAISREMQDEFAVESHKKAIAAAERGDFKDEIVPVMVPQPKGEALAIAVDEGPRADASKEKLGKLKPAFEKDGTVTAGNASTINDGASVLLVMSEKKAKELGLEVLAVDRRLRDRRHGAAVGDDGAREGGREVARENEDPHHRLRPGRVERGLRGARCGADSRAQDSARETQRERRCRRPRSSHRCVGRARA